MIQAIVCKNDVGWRDNSRKIVLYASDGLMHIAGEGQLGKIYYKMNKPNNENLYTIKSLSFL